MRRIPTHPSSHPDGLALTRVGTRSDTISRFGNRAGSDALIVFLLLAATIAWSAVSGKDLSWDQLNYHFYVAFSFLHERIAHDFMAANGQSYLNPLAYVPFYLMVAHGWHSVLIASVLAAFHSLNVILSYFIAKTVVEDPGGRGRIAAALGALLALLSPIFLTEAGTTFADVTTAVFVFAGLLCALRADPTLPRWSSRIFLAGAFFGIGCALKLSNLVFSLAFAVLLIWLHPARGRSLRALLLFGIGAAGGLVAAHGYWSWQLWKTFGDPPAPILGVLLGSPEIPSTTAMLPQRFLPDSLLEAVTLPFRMMQLRSWIYVENVAPDLRFAATIIILIIAAAAWILRRKALAANNVPVNGSRKRQALVAFFIVALAAWIATSSNGRYGIVVSILCGAVLAVLVQTVWRRQAIIVPVLAVLIAAQLLHLGHFRPRLGGEKWTQSWYEASVPERLTREPYLYISISGNSASYIAAFVHPDSAFTNPIGQLSFDFDGPGGARLRALLQAHQGRARVMAPIAAPDDNVAIIRWTLNASTTIARLGYAVDASDCATITTAGPQWRLGEEDAGPGGNEHLNHVRTCALYARPYEHAAERSRARKIVQEIESWCPKLFRSSYGTVEQTPDGWYASYVGTDTTLTISGDRIFINQPRTFADLYLGTLDQWKRGVRPDCAAIPSKLRKLYGSE